MNLKLKIGSFTKWKVLALVALLGSCSSVPIEVQVEFSIPEEDYTVFAEITDDGEFVEISLHSLSSRPMCIDFESWPNQWGQLHYASQILSIEVEGVNYSVRDENLGRVLGDVGFIRVEPNSNLTGRIPLKSFNLSRIPDPGDIPVRYIYRPHFCLD